MTQGKVTVNNLNRAQGEIPEIERTLLFIGPAPTNQGKVIPVNTQTNFDTELGVASSALKTNLQAAMANAGQNWQAFALPMADAATDAHYLAAIDSAMSKCSPEGIVILKPATTMLAINAYQTKLMELRAVWGRFLFALVAMPGAALDKTWADYYASMKALADPVSANMVSLVPQLHGNDVGVLAGRLCSRAVSIADTPMRVATGAVVGLGPVPMAAGNVELPEATLAALSEARFSVVQHYADYPGTYFADGMMLETPNGDYKVIEYVRVMLKAMRAVRLIALSKIGDRSFNSTHHSIEQNKGDLLEPLRQMAKSITFAGVTYPGEIEPPTEESVGILWKSKSKVDIYLILRPYNCPKDITANLVLDLSNEVTA